MNNDEILDLINKDIWNVDDKNMFKLIDNNNKNIFHYACIRGKVEIIDHALKLNSNKILLSDNDGNTGAHLLGLSGWDNILKNVIEEETIFLKIKNNDDKFIYDIVLSRPNTFKHVINIMYKSNLFEYVNYVKYDNRTLLHNIIDIADHNNTYCEILKYLNELNVNWERPKSSPALIYAINNRKINVCNYILDNIDVDVNVISSDQYTPLIISIFNNKKDIAIKLINKGADVNYAGPENKFVPLSLCFKTGFYDVAEEILKNEKLDYDKTDMLLNMPIYYFINSIIKFTQMNNELKNKLTNMFEKLINNSNMLISNNAGIKILDYINNVKNDLAMTLGDKIRDIIDNVNKNVDKVVDESKKINIVLPMIHSSDDDNIVDTTFGLFNSDTIHNLMYIIYLLNTYNDTVIPLQYPNKNKNKLDKYKISLIIRNNNITKLIDDVLTFYMEYFHSTLPHILFWANKKLYFKDENITIYLKRAINSKKRFVIMKLTIVPNEEALHANMIIYDSKRNILTRFEPYGDWEFSDAYYLDKKILHIFKKVLDKDIYKTLKFYKPGDYLDKTKFQSLSLGDIRRFKHLGDPFGYCLAWCYWFLELKLLNPDVNEKNLVENALNKVIKNGKNSKNPLLDHIRGFAKKLDNEKNSLFLKIGIDVSEIYKLSYNENNIKAIKEYIDKYVIDSLTTK